MHWEANLKNGFVVYPINVFEKFSDKICVMFDKYENHMINMKNNFLHRMQHVAAIHATNHDHPFQLIHRCSSSTHFTIPL